MDIEAVVGKEEYKVDVAAELRIDKNNLSDELAEQASRLGFYATLAEVLRSSLEHKKLAMEILLALKYKLKKTELNKTEDRVTEKAISSAVTLDEEVIEEQEKLIDAGTKYREFFALVDSFRQRGMMVASLAKLAALEFGEEGMSVKKSLGKERFTR